MFRKGSTKSRAFIPYIHSFNCYILPSKHPRACARPCQNHPLFDYSCFHEKSSPVVTSSSASKEPYTLSWQTSDSSIYLWLTVVIYIPTDQQPKCTHVLHRAYRLRSIEPSSHPPLPLNTSRAFFFFLSCFHRAFLQRDLLSLSLLHQDFTLYINSSVLLSI